MRTHLLNKLRRFSRSHQTTHSRGGFSPMESLEGRTLLSGVVDVDLQVPDDGAYYQLLTTSVAAAVAKPTVTVKATDARATESAAKRPDLGYFTFTRTGATTQPLTVRFNIAGTAKNGADYETIANSITIPAGKATASIVIKAINDTRIEKTEAIRIELAANAAYTVGAASQDSVGIVDNDGPVITVTAPNATGTELSSGGGKFVLTRTGSLAAPLTVYYTLRGTAKNGVDYKQVTGVATFKAKKSTTEVIITPIDDLRVEPSETVNLRLANGLYVIANPNGAVLTLEDNDHAATADGPGAIAWVGEAGAQGNSYLFYVSANKDLNATLTPTELSKSLDGFSAGKDFGVSLSPNGEWLLLHSDRFGGQAGTGSLVIVSKNNLGSGKQIKVGGNLIIPASGSNSAVGNNGDLVVYASAEGPHDLDLWAVKYAAGAWSKVLLTENSAFAYNMQPALSADGAKILFVGANAAGAKGAVIAEVNTDGTGYHTLVTDQGQVSHPDYGVNNDIVFGSDLDGDRIWRRTNAGVLSLISGATNEFAPAVLPDGRIVSLWAQEAGVYELTIRSANGVLQRTILPDASFPIISLGVGA